MDNVLSPLLSNLFMDEYIKQKLNTINTKLWRYVDDPFIIITMNKEELDEYVNNLNKRKGTIKFTYEFESNNKLSYLDTTLTKNITNKKIDIKWYRKETATDRLLHYESGHHQSIKTNLIKNITTRIINTTKDNVQQQQDLEKLKDMLKKSKYPLQMIEKTITESMKNINNTHTITETNNNRKDETELILTLPYAPGMEVLKRKLEKLKIKLYFSYPKKLNSLVTNSIKPESKSIIYQMECERGSIYNGETKVGLKTEQNNTKC